MIESIFSENVIEILKSAKGKSNENLYSHLEKTGQFTESIIDRIQISEDALSILSQISLNEKLIKETLIFQSYTHDLGKLDKWFQNKLIGGDYWNNLECKPYQKQIINLNKKLRNDYQNRFIKSTEDILNLEDEVKNKEPTDINAIKCFIRNKLCPLRPHALFSLPLEKKYLDLFLENNFSNLDDIAKDFLISLALLSIATHHSDYHPDLYKSYEFDETIYEGLNHKTNESYSLLNDSYNNLKRFPDDLTRYMYTIFNGLLRMSDWAASGNLSTNEIILGPNEPKNNVNGFIVTKYGSLRNYQEYVGNFDLKSSCHFKLPTGDGKTETALLVNVNANKLVYTLPTITTIESMRHRFEKNYFNQNEVSFSHHLLFLSLYKEGRLDEKTHHQYFMKKAIVTSIDRILLSLMNSRHYPLLEMALNNSYMVIDEIHSYSPYTLSLILNALEYLRKFHNTKIMVMSATLPELIEKELASRIESKEIFPQDMIEKRYKSKKRVELDYKDEYLDNYIDEIVKGFENGRKVLVVLNTVNNSVDTFKRIVEKKKSLKYGKEILLLHSRFTQEDRDQKNRFIEKLKGKKYKERPFILVSTQVVEVSLDIDFDIMFTEISPFDSLVQRCGRVNRKGKKGVSQVRIFNVERELPYEKSQIDETKSILKNFQNRNEWEFIQANNLYYNSMKEKYQLEFGRNALDSFLKRISKSKYGELVSTRDNFITIPTIPAGPHGVIYDEIKIIMNEWSDLSGSEKTDSLVKILGNIVNMPIYVVSKLNPEPAEKFGFTFIQSDYDSKMGIKPKKAVLIW